MEAARRKGETSPMTDTEKAQRDFHLRDVYQQNLPSADIVVVEPDLTSAASTMSRVINRQTGA